MYQWRNLWTNSAHMVLTISFRIENNLCLSLAPVLQHTQILAVALVCICLCFSLEAKRFSFKLFVLLYVKIKQHAQVLHFKDFYIFFSNTKTCFSSKSMYMFTGIQR